MTPSRHYTILIRTPSLETPESQTGRLRVPHTPDSGTRVRKTSWECGEAGPSRKSPLGFLSQESFWIHLLFPRTGAQAMHMKGFLVGHQNHWSRYIYPGPTFRDSDSGGLGWCLGICIFKELPQRSPSLPGCETTALGCKCSFSTTCPKIKEDLSGVSKKWLLLTSLTKG